MKKVVGLVLVALVALGVFTSGCINSNIASKATNTPTTTATKTVTLVVATPGDPNAVPLLLLKAHPEWLKANNLTVNLKVVPLPALNHTKLIEMLKNQKVDIALMNSFGAAKLYAHGLKNLHIVETHVWNPLYILTPENITNWSQINNTNGVAIPALGLPPHVFAVKALAKGGVKVNFTGMAPGPELFKALAQGKFKVVAAPEPVVSMILLTEKKEKWPVQYKVFASDAQILAPKTGIPLGSVIVVNDTLLSNPTYKEALKVFLAGFQKSIDMINKKEVTDADAQKISQEWGHLFGKPLPPMVIETAIASGRLGLKYEPASNVKGILLKWWEDAGITNVQGFIVNVS